MINFLDERNLRLQALKKQGEGSVELFKNSIQNNPAIIEKQKIFDAVDYSLSLNYYHNGLSKESYISHPLRVALLTLNYIKNLETDYIILALLHNVYEVTTVNKEDLIKYFGEEIHNSIEVLTVDRKKQWEKSYKKSFYDEIMAASLQTKLIKILDKFDNIFLINSNKDYSIRIKYLSEIKEYILPMTKKYLPIIYDDFVISCIEAEKLCNISS